jgi:hypothetical protein
MNRKIRLQTKDTELIEAEVVTPFESAVDNTGARWRYHGIGSHGNLWRLESSTRSTNSGRGKPRASVIYALEL